MSLGLRALNLVQTYASRPLNTFHLMSETLHPATLAHYVTDLRSATLLDVGPLDVICGFLRFLFRRDPMMARDIHHL
jgi:hypothetical protein